MPDSTTTATAAQQTKAEAFAKLAAMTVEMKRIAPNESLRMLLEQCETALSLSDAGASMQFMQEFCLEMSRTFVQYALNIAEIKGRLSK